MDVIKHDSLQYKSSFYGSNCHVHKNENKITVGYLHVDMLNKDVIEVQSGTYEKYSIKIPYEMKNLANSHQFNLEFELVK